MSKEVSDLSLVKCLQSHNLSNTNKSYSLVIAEQGLHALCPIQCLRRISSSQDRMFPFFTAPIKVDKHGVPITVLDKEVRFPKVSKYEISPECNSLIA